MRVGLTVLIKRGYQCQINENLSTGSPPSRCVLLVRVERRESPRLTLGGRLGGELNNHVGGCLRGQMWSGSYSLVRCCCP